MKFVLVDPKKRKVSEVDCAPVFHGKNGIYEVMGCELVQGFTFLDGVHTCYVDERGRVTGPEKELSYVHFKGADFPIAGRMLIMGPGDEEGKETPCRLEVSEVEALVAKYEDGFIPVPPLKMEGI